MDLRSYFLPGPFVVQRNEVKAKKQTKNEDCFLVGTAQHNTTHQARHGKREGDEGMMMMMKKKALFEERSISKRLDGANGTN